MSRELNVDIRYLRQRQVKTTGNRPRPSEWLWFLSLPLPFPSQPSRLSQSPGFSSLSNTANSHWLFFFTHGNVCFHIILSIPPYFLPPPPSEKVLLYFFTCTLSVSPHSSFFKSIMNISPFLLILKDIFLLSHSQYHFLS